MTAPEIYALARAAGFPPIVAVTMTAIALRESGGIPTAFNGNAATGDRSYGLWQINMRDPAVAALLQKEKLLVVDPTASGDEENQLFHPATNARAAFLLWNGNNHNLNVAWYIDRDEYQRRYEAHLPVAQAAALALETQTP